MLKESQAHGGDGFMGGGSKLLVMKESQASGRGVFFWGGGPQHCCASAEGITGPWQDWVLRLVKGGD